MGRARVDRYPSDYRDSVFVSKDYNERIEYGVRPNTL